MTSERGKYDCVVCGENISRNTPRHTDPQRHYHCDRLMGTMWVEMRKERDILRAELAAVREERNSLQTFAALQDAWETEAMRDITMLLKERNELRHRAERMERVVDLLRIVSVLPSPDLLTDGDWADLCDAVRVLDAAEGGE